MKTPLKSMQCWMFALTFAVVWSRCGETAAQEPSFGGKTVRIVVGFSAGGGFDAYARAIARHVGRYLPGNPAVIVENMPGAGSLIAANHLYNQARPDGLTIGHFIGGLILGQLFGNPGTQFDARQFEWVGAPAKLEAVCALTKASGITDLKQWASAKAPVKLGATGPGSETYDVPKVLQAALHLPMQVVSGYKGTADIRVAAESGELAGMCWGWEAMKVQWSNFLKSGDAHVVLQAMPAAHPDLLGIPVAVESAKAEDAKQLIRIGIHDQSAILRPYALPPKTPGNIVAAVRRAFQRTLDDPKFRSEMNQAKLSVDPVKPEEIDAIVDRLLRLDASVVAGLKEILAVKK
jgi:tripartite-type tricarboxylate transporter receptor subunit TctC